MTTTHFYINEKMVNENELHNMLLFNYSFLDKRDDDEIEYFIEEFFEDENYDEMKPVIFMMFNEHIKSTKIYKEIYNKMTDFSYQKDYKDRVIETIPLLIKLLQKEICKFFKIKEPWIEYSGNNFKIYMKFNDKKTFDNKITKEIIKYNIDRLNELINLGLYFRRFNTNIKVSFL